MFFETSLTFCIRPDPYVRIRNTNKRNALPPGASIKTQGPPLVLNVKRELWLVSPNEIEIASSAFRCFRSSCGWSRFLETLAL
jgi:hypothetical protein